MSTTVTRRHTPSIPTACCILLVDDDDQVAELVRSALHGTEGLVLEHARTLSGALKKCASLSPRVVLARTELPDSNGVGTIDALHNSQPSVPIVAIGDIGRFDAARFEAAGVRAWLRRETLTRRTVQRAIERALMPTEMSASVAQLRTGEATPLLGVSQTVGLLLLRADGSIRSCNAAMARLLGYETVNELIGANLRELLVNTEDWTAWCESGSSISTVRVTVLDKDGSEVHLKGDVRPRHDQSGALTGFESVFVDVTEQQKLSKALQSASRTEALGALTSGVAHDFNNLLTVIVGNLYLLVESVRDNEQLLSKAKIARDAARRGSDLTKQLLSFARQKSADPEKIYFPTVIEKLTLLLERALGKKVKLNTRVGREIWPILADVTQLESVLINLAVNARDAMDGEGTVTIGAENIRLDAAAANLGLEPGEYVSAYVSDEGPGVPAEIRNQVFEPFFTTKQGRGGTGLGLSMVRHLMELSGGAVSIDDRDGGGAVVRLFFPRARGSSAQTSVDLTQPLSTLPTGDERVLVLSSDTGVSSTVEQLLNVLGYSVVLASGPDQVMEELDRRSADLLLTELILGHGVSFEQLISEARKRAPELKLLIIADDAQAGKLPAAQGHLRKPFSLADLANSVRRALN